MTVTKQMTEMSLSCEETGASGSKVELTEPGGYKKMDLLLITGYKLSHQYIGYNVKQSST